MIGDSLKTRKDWTDDGIGKEKKPNLLYIIIVLGMNFFRKSMDSLVKHRPYTTQYVLEHDSVPC
jgi:hypothetical protein